MNYNKGPQLTIGDLKRYLEHIPNDVKIYIGIGNINAELHYLSVWNNQLLLHPDIYMQNAEEANLKTVLMLAKKD